MKLIYRLVILFVLAVSNVSAQDYNKLFTEGNFLILEENYVQALKNFLEAYKVDSTNANINYKIGQCYLKIPDQKYKALPYLEKAVQSVRKNYAPDEPREKNAPVNAHYYLAMAYHLNYKFDDAINRFNTYSEFLSPKKQPDLVKDVAYRIELAKNAKEFVSAPLDVKITNMGDSVNSPYAEYSPVISVDETMLIFTSRRGSMEKTADDLFYEDIYISFRRPDSTWTTPVSISPNINTDADHEAAIGLSADGQTLLVYKDDNGGDIYESHLQGDQWSPLEKVGKENNSDINTSSWEPSASITADGKMLYFVSDRKGGFGGRDLYRAVKLPNGKWSKAKNLGPTVNTPYDEDAPFIHPDQKTLFFSSKGHKNMGGFDIFFTSFENDSAWTQPINMGYPINSPDDDIFYVTSADGKRAYYATTKPGGKGEKDLYVISFKKHVLTDPIALVIGDLIPGPGEPIPDNEIVATNVESGEIVQISRARTRDGRFVISLKPGANYNLSYVVNGEEIKNETINVPSDIIYEEIERKIYVKGDPDSLVIRDPGKDTTKVDTGDPKDPKNPKDPKGKELLTVEGTIYADSSPLANTGVKLQNAAGKVIETGTTDASGRFSFKNLPANTSYTVQVIDEIDGDLTADVAVTSSKGNVPVENVQKTGTTSKYQVKGGKSTITVKAKKKKTPVVNNDPQPKEKELYTITAALNAGSSPIANSTVKVTDAAGKVVQTGTTDANGQLVLNDLAATGNYTLTIAEEIEGALSATVTVSSSKSGDVKVNNLQQGATTAKFQLGNARKNTITVKAKKKKAPVAVNNNNQPREKLDQFTGKEFRMNFKYNVNEIDPQSEAFTGFIDVLVNEINTKGSVDLRILGSASMVPTRKFSSNKELAQARAESGKQKIIEALKAKGIDPSKVTFSRVKGQVNGPVYNGDFDLNRKAYEQHQYIKITVYSK